MLVAIFYFVRHVRDWGWDLCFFIDSLLFDPDDHQPELFYSRCAHDPVFQKTVFGHQAASS
jgi:hypothetical protein